MTNYELNYELNAGFQYDEQSLLREMVADPSPPFQLHSATSLAAAKEITPNVANLREKVFAAISNSPVGMTDLELEAETGMKGSTVRPRRIELQRAGRIVSAGTRPTSSGRKAVVWTVKR